MFKTLIPSTIFFLFCTIISAVTGLSPRVELWNNELSGSILGAGGLGRADIVKKSDHAPGFGIDMHILGFSSRLSYQPIDYRTTLNVRSNLTFDGQAYQVNDTLNYRMDWNTWDWTYRFVSTGAFGSKLNVLAGLQWIDAAVSVDGTRGGDPVASSSFSENIPLPYVGLEAEVSLKQNLRFLGAFKLLELDIAGNELSFADSQLGFRYLFDGKSERLGAIFLGYRKRKFDVAINQGDADEAHIDFELDGLFGEFRFHW